VELFKYLGNTKERFRMKKNGRIPRKFYIAHSIIERDHVKGICLKLQAIGIETFNPFYLPDGSWRPERPEIRRIDEGKLDPYYIKNKSKANGIVEADLRLIEAADGIIALLKSPSVGTSMEIFFCSYILHKPTFVITEKAFKHAWVMALATERFKNLDDFIRWYKRNYPINPTKLEVEEIKIEGINDGTGRKDDGRDQQTSDTHSD
jgi:nucleoside 2-deoxyribosyltransferase